LTGDPFRMHAKLLRFFLFIFSDIALTMGPELTDLVDTFN